MNLVVMNKEEKSLNKLLIIDKILNSSNKFGGFFIGIFQLKDKEMIIFENK